MKAIDLFSGCGGLTHGLKKAGFEVLAAVELLEHARETYKANHENISLYGDIREVSGIQLMENHNLKTGELDLLAGCPPCQGFSRMRTKNRSTPAEDERNELIFEFLRLALELKPKAILMENVPGLMKDERMIKTIASLEKHGYDVAIDVLDAANFGVAQRRKRMILVASRVGTASLPVGKNKSITVADKLEKLASPGKSGKYWHDITRVHTEKVQNIIKRIPKDGGSRSALGDDQLPCHKRLNGGFRDVYGRMSWNKVSPTITRSCTNPSKGRFLHPDQDRAITPYEAALLQSFPKSYIFPVSLTITQVESMIGEALPPKFAEKQARHVIKHVLKQE